MCIYMCACMCACVSVYKYVHIYLEPWRVREFGEKGRDYERDSQCVYVTALGGRTELRLGEMIPFAADVRDFPLCLYQDKGQKEFSPIN